MISPSHFTSTPFLQEAALHPELHPPEPVSLLHPEGRLSVGQGQCALLQLRHTALPRPTILLGKAVPSLKAGSCLGEAAPTILPPLRALK
jgi:hypothetical protein